LDLCDYLKRNVISKRLALLVGSKHIGQPTTPEAYIGMLLEHVAGMEPFSYLALESACRELETEKKFLPDISEVVEAIRRHDDMWERRKGAFWSIKRAAADLANLIATEQPRVEVEQAEAREDHARRALNRALDVLGHQKREATSKQEAAANAAQEAQDAVAQIACFEAKVIEACNAVEAAKAELDAAAATWWKIRGGSK
jgi:chromosome segregation ATPase